MAHTTWLIGRDQASPNYTVLYFDDRRVSRVYEMSFAGLTWNIWRNGPNFFRRFGGTFSDDKSTIPARGENQRMG